jgi:hypothetical protein
MLSDSEVALPGAPKEGLRDLWECSIALVREPEAVDMELRGWRRRPKPGDAVHTELSAS